MHRLVALWLALVILVSGSLIGISAAFGQTEDARSPALGQASVIAHGVAAMPSGEVGWRVRLATASEELDQASRNAPGFVLADQGALLVNELESNRQTRLASGEAAFIPLQAPLQEIPLGDGTVSYYRIDLVAADAVSDPGNDQLVFIGEPFTSPGGSRDLDLVRDVLDADESLDLALGSYAAPALLLVTSGALELVPADNPSAQPVRLPAGQGAAIGGDVIARAGDGVEATFVTAIVGPEVPPILAQEAATATPTPTPTPELASLTVQALACPVAYEGTQYAVDCLEPLADIAFELGAAATGISLQGTTGPDGTVTFADLAPDTYVLAGGVPGEFAVQVVECANEDGQLAAEASQTGVPGAIVAVESGDTVACRWFVVPEDLRGEDEGTVAVAVHLCPGTPVDPYADCSLGDASGVVIDGPVVLTTDAASAVPVQIQGASVVWGEEGGVPFGTYFLQPGGIAVPAEYELSEVRGSVGASGNGWTFTIDEANPNAILDVIYVPAEQPAEEEDADSDGDGLTDTQEAELGTDPANPDTDEDGLFDGAEAAAGTDPLIYDTDDDGFGDNAEVNEGSDPTDPSSVPEGEPTVDTDGDMLTDAQEAELGTNAATPDTDGDGLTDFAEVGFEPGSSTGTDPLVFDTDGDGVGDGDEIANGTDPTDPTST
ncbi:MAG: hypothetical protein KY456_03105 [Chloroflexi bacterium]|nr:hypothetical protein [Chloroflexota bacterium]